jgi:hypothetical protein
LFDKGGIKYSNDIYNINKIKKNRIEIKDDKNKIKKVLPFEITTIN